MGEGSGKGSGKPAVGGKGSAAADHVCTHRGWWLQPNVAKWPSGVGDFTDEKLDAEETNLLEMQLNVMQDQLDVIAKNPILCQILDGRRPELVFGDGEKRIMETFKNQRRRVQLSLNLILKEKRKRGLVTRYLQDSVSRGHEQDPTMAVGGSGQWYHSKASYPHEWPKDMVTLARQRAGRAAGSSSSASLAVGRRWPQCVQQQWSSIFKDQEGEDQAAISDKQGNEDQEFNNKDQSFKNKFEAWFENDEEECQAAIGIKQSNEDKEFNEELEALSRRWRSSQQAKPAVGGKSGKGKKSKEVRLATPKPPPGRPPAPRTPPGPPPAPRTPPGPPPNWPKKAKVTIDNFSKSRGAIGAAPTQHPPYGPMGGKKRTLIAHELADGWYISRPLLADS